MKKRAITNSFEKLMAVQVVIRSAEKLISSCLQLIFRDMERNIRSFIRYTFNIQSLSINPFET